MSYARPEIERMHGYVPGEQPKVPGLIKLNTNENPYPPSPKVLEALRGAIDGSLRLYPDPHGTALRQQLAERYQLNADTILLGNGCDDILNLAMRAFVGTGDTVAWFAPSYSLYPVLAEIQGARPLAWPLDASLQIQVPADCAGVKLAFVTQPNAPSGVWLQTEALKTLIQRMPGVVLIDEAYVDFGRETCLALARQYPNVLVARTFSKSASLAGMRLGWVTGSPELIGALNKVKDSYNVNRLTLVAGAAALADRAYFDDMVNKVKTTRNRVLVELIKLGFDVPPSQANFLFAKPPAPLTAQGWFQHLRTRNILVRWWDADRIRAYARVSIGTDAEMDQFLEVTREALR